MNISLPILFIDTSADLCKIVLIKSEECIIEKTKQNFKQ